MNKTAMMNAMIEKYDEKSFTHNYIFGIVVSGIVYAIKATSEILPFILTLDSASRGNGYSLRFKPTNGQKEILLAKGAKALCSARFFDAEVAASKYNRGEIFEKMVTESFGQEWKKDNVPFTDDGDITVDGIAYQIKYEKATFTTEKQLARL